MDDTARAAAAEAARRRVKRAQGQLSDAVHELAQLAGDLTVVGVTRVHDDDSACAAQEFVRLGVGRHGAVDVVVIARPTGRSRQPTTARQGEGDGNERNGDGRAAKGARERRAVGGEEGTAR